MKEKYEDIDNIRLSCEKCSDDKLNDFQEFFETNVAVDGDDFVKTFIKAISNGTLYFKCAIKQDEVVEHIWFKVTEFDYSEDYFKGTLNNTPYLIEGYEFGDICELKFSDVSEYIM